MSIANRPLPRPTQITQPFWDAARAGRIDIPSCKKCNTLQFYPRAICTTCMHDEFDWKTCAGTGHIYTYTVNNRAANSYMKGKTPYVVAVVELDEGVRMMANIIETQIEEVKIGAKVQVVFEPVSDDITLVQFKVIA